MKSHAQIMSELREWHAKWMRRKPTRYDAQAWDEVLSELSEILPADTTKERVALFGPLVNRYIEDIERVSIAPANNPLGYTE